MNSEQEPKKVFYPDYLFEILVATILTIELTLIISFLFPPAIGREIDFNAMYRPLPEWYFLWVFELIKYFPGKWTFVGSMLIPTLVFMIIMFAPFLDRTPECALRKRPLATIIAATLVIVISALTIISL
jgi:quinol-cytochrome oxidoreductase complex cytochrome b subunit